MMDGYCAPKVRDTVLCFLFIYFFEVRYWVIIWCSDEWTTVSWIHVTFSLWIVNLWSTRTTTPRRDQHNTNFGRILKVCSGPLGYMLVTSKLFGQVLLLYDEIGAFGTYWNEDGSISCTYFIIFIFTNAIQFWKLVKKSV